MPGVLSYNEAERALDLSLPFDDALKDKAKSVPGRRWVKRSKCWRWPATVETAQQVVALLDPDAGYGYADWWKRAKAERAAADRAIAVLEGRAESTGDFGFTFRTEPYLEQRAYCEWAAIRDLGGLTYRANFSEQGYGKSKVEIDLTTWELDRKLMHGFPVVFCPNHLKKNWATEVYVHGLPGLFQPLSVSGSVEQKLKTIEAARDMVRVAGMCPFLLVNYEVLSQPSQVPVFERLLELAKSGEIGKVIFDESSMLKNVKSNRGEQALDMARAVPIRVVMTGTPYPNSLLDAYNPMHLLDESIIGMGYPAFMVHHTERGDWNAIVGYRHLDELREKIDRHAFRRLLEECVDLPEEVDLYRYCEMSPEQVRVTKRLRDQYLAELETEDGAKWVLNATHVLTRLLRFNQVTSGFLEDKERDQRTTFTPNPKLNLLLSIVRDEVPEADKGVIWCAYKEDVRQVHKALEKKKIRSACYYGDMTDDEKSAAEDAFMGDPEIRFIVATLDAAAFGKNWQVANWCLFYSYNFRWELAYQARARIRRATQKKRMAFIWLVARNSEVEAATHGAASGINQYIIDNLAETSRMAEFMTGDYEKHGIDPKTLMKQVLEAVV